MSRRRSTAGGDFLIAAIIGAAFVFAIIGILAASLGVSPR